MALPHGPSPLEGRLARTCCLTPPSKGPRHQAALVVGVVLGLGEPTGQGRGWDSTSSVTGGVLTCATEAVAGVGCGRGPALPTLPPFSPDLGESENSKCEPGLPGDSEGFARWEEKTYFSEHCVTLILALPI